uniref:NADH-ubiquinone oxidoreductase chain 2 n=1 Tax=Aderidae sp. GENSP01 TaxID=1205532 RepID=A0A0S2MPA4_9CUCU|nr:NADH deshydrogenase subunit 2 [Aderidae sp. GENSP01]
MLKFNKIMFFNIMLMGIIISISSISWFTMWMGLEINLMAIIPLMVMINNSYSSEASMKYFITQTFASMILIFSIMNLLINNEFMNFKSIFINIINIALLTKLGMAPFHFWFPEVIQGLNWLNSLIILTIQKITPFMIIMSIHMQNIIFQFSIFSSLIISTISSINQTSLRKILAYSSINHLAWMMTISMNSFSTWFMYYLTYIYITANLILMFYLLNIYFMPQIFNMFNNSKMMKLIFFSNFLSLSGIPPLIGFIPKWMTIYMLINKKMFFITFILILMTIIMIFIYMQFFINSLILNFNEKKNNYNKNYYSLLIPLSIMNFFSFIIFFNYM